MIVHTSAIVLYISICSIQNQRFVGELNSDFDHVWKLMLFHLTFFIIIVLIGLNIIFGIIVDTFSELRDLKVRCVCLPRECLFLIYSQGFDV